MNYKKIKTFEHACKALSADAKALPDFSMLPLKHQKALTAHAKLVLIADALNEGWQPNWDDGNEYKWVPWLYVQKDKGKPSGFGLSLYVVVFWITYTYVGSRLCYKSREVAKYAFETFKDLYEEYMLINI